MSRHLMISSDCHAGLQPGKYREYIDPQHRKAYDDQVAGQIAQFKESAKAFMVSEFADEWERDKEEGLTGAWDSDRRNAALDADGVVGEVVFPDGLTGGNSPPLGAGLTLPTDCDSQLQLAGARAHNRWVADFCSLAPARRAGLAIVPILQDIDAAVTEIEWAAKAGLRGGIMIPSMWRDHPAYHHPRYEPIWAACADLNMPIHTHVAAAPELEPHPGSIGIYITEVVWWSVRPMWFLIWSGVFERHPKLKFLVSEGGVDWAPSLLKMMDQRFTANRTNAKMGDFHKNLSMKPSEYFDQNCWVGSFLTRDEVEARHEIGVGNLMWTSDYPHPEGTWPDSKNLVIEAFRGAPEEETRAMLGGNAAEVFGFDIDALAPLTERVGPEVAAFEGD
ncbi:MAG: amidohydrolase [bacterium]|nr:amidohydrolase [bacterium]MCP5070998.1 amidohydrolase [bacterium]